MIRAIQKILVYGIFISLMAFSPNLLDGALLSKWTALALTLMLTSMLILFFRSQFTLDLTQLKKNALFFNWLLFYLLTRIVAFAYADNTSDAYFDLVREALFIILLFLLFVAFKDSENVIKSLRLPVILFVCVSLAAALYQLIPLLINRQYEAKTSYLVTSLFAHRNMFSHMLVLSIPLLLPEINKTGAMTWLKRALLFTAIVFLAILYCRAAWLSLLVASLASAVYFIWSKTDGRAFVYALRKNYLVLLALGIAIVGFVFWDATELSKQWHSLSHWHYGSVHNRLKLWEASVAILQEHPFMGAGLSAWKIEILRFISSSDITNGGYTFYQRPHNDFIWLWTESGLLSVSSFVLLFALVIYKGFRQPYSPIIVAAVFGIAAYLVMAFLSFPRERMEHQVWLAFYFFIILSHKNNGQSTSQSAWPTWPFLIAIVVLTTSIFVLFSRLKGEFYTAGAFANDTENWQSKIDYLDKAENRFYKIDATSTPLAYHRALNYLNLGDVVNAEMQLKKALHINPNHLHVLNYYASVQYGKGDIAMAESCYQRILDLKPDHNDALVNLAVISVRNHEVDSAMVYLSKTDLKNLTEQHRDAIVAISKVKLKLIEEKTDDAEIKNQVHQLWFDESWIFEIFTKAINDERSFEEQVLLDARYILVK